MDRRRESTIQSAVPVVVFESCERCFDSVCVDLFGLAQSVHIPSLRTAQQAALARLAATAPSKVDSREGRLHWWRLLLENLELNSNSMSKDMQVLMRKDLQQLSCFDSWASTVLTGGSDGAWVGDPTLPYPTCEALTCSIGDLFLNGSLSGPNCASWTMGESCAVTCATGYQAANDTSGTLTCA